MQDDERRAYRRYHRTLPFIPAGVLIGLGAGLLFGHPGPGILIGIGAGFLATGLIVPKKAEEAERSSYPSSIGWGMVFAGIIFILLGLVIAYAPFIIWPYLIAVFFILLGVWMLIRSYYRYSESVS